MPHLPNKPCAQPGCRALVPRGTRRCQSCQSVETRKYNQEQRPKAHSFYPSPEWRAFRAEALRRFGNRCCQCGHVSDRANPIEFDHIVSIKQAPERALDITNVRPLCRRCHSRRTAQEQGRWQRRA